MTIEEARKILKEDGKNLTDEQVLEFISSATLLSDIFFDMWYKMTPAERNKWKKKSSIKRKQA